MSYVKCIGCEYIDTPQKILNHAEFAKRWGGAQHGLEPPRSGDYFCLCGGAGTMADVIEHVTAENARRDGTRHAIDLRQGTAP